MRTTTLLLVLLTLSCGASAANSITIGKKVYFEAYREENKDGSLREYVQPSESLDTWTTLIGVRIFNKLTSPKEYILNMAAEYKRRFPLNQFAIFENHKTGGWIVDYIIFPSDLTEGVIEWNFFEAVPNKSGGGILVNQFAARRTVVNSLRETMKEWNFKEYRTSMFPLLVESGFPIKEEESGRRKTP
ncbi:MAG TPA: hypothetical protein VHD61_12460 [Lacunisphaera sp.]|nr:hypothetical protein [Lacunisphaera sp.]